MNGANGMSDIEGKVTRGMSECVWGGERGSIVKFRIGAQLDSAVRQCARSSSAR